MKSGPQHGSKTKLLDAALHAFRAKGYAATTIDDVCHAAGVTKGSFFHHFASKDELGRAAADHFSAAAERLFADADFHQAKDPLERLLGYVDLRIALLAGELPDYTCLLGTLVQETYATHPDIRSACDRGLSIHIDALARDLEAARQRYAPEATWSAASVADFIQAVLQGSFVLAKARQGPEVARDNLAHLRRYLQLLFAGAGPAKRKGKR